MKEILLLPYLRKQAGRRWLVVGSILLLFGWFAWQYFCGCPSASSPAPTGPPLVLLGWGISRKDANFGALHFPTGEFTSISLAQNSGKNSLSGGAIQGGYYVAPYAVSDSAYSLWRWKVKGSGSWARTDILPLKQTPVRNIALSPNGRLTAFWIKAADKDEIYLVDWTTKQVRRALALPDPNGDIGGVEVSQACADDGTLYVGQGDKGQPCDFKRYRHDGTGEAIGKAFNQVVINRAGTFGATYQVEKGCINLEIADLDHPSEPPSHYAFAYASPLQLGLMGLPRYYLGPLLSSENGQWWALQAKEFNHMVPSVLVAWKRGQEQPYYVVPDIFKLFVPVGLTNAWP